MSPARCPRLFEVEAARDGRLGGAERESFERHVTTCAACLAESRALEGIAEALRAPAPDAGAEDRLHARRERTRLLAAFDATIVSPRPGPRRRGLAWATAAMVVAGAIVFWRSRPGSPPAHASAVVHADSATQWSERADGDRETIVLERGALWIHVDHAAGGGRLLVVLPDGVLEDTGTTFTVSAEGGRTTRVAVHDGSVVLRLRGVPPVAIGGGDAWTPPAPPAASACVSATPPVVASARPEEPQRTSRASRSLGAPAPAPAPAPAIASAPAPSSTSSSSPASAATPDPEASADFRAAMAALDAGDNTAAATAFAGFLARHPGDPRAEDAAYLRVLALQRSGDGPGVRAAAQAYLRRYPQGFRRAEMETLAR